MKRKTRQSRSRARGASMIALCLIIGFLILPPIGVFVFELNRYQFVQRQLEKIVDAASLAAGRRMAEANVMAAADETEAQYWRHLQGIEAAWDFISGYELLNGAGQTKPTQFIYSIGLTRQAGPGHLVQVPPAARGATLPPIDSSIPKEPNQGACRIYPCNPDKNFEQVPMGDAAGRAIAVEVVFNEVPAFAKYLGFGYVPVRTISSAGAARVDIVLCMDMSGSMDDCTRITAVSEVVSMLDPQGDQALYTNPGPPPNAPPVTSYAACTFAPPSMCGDSQTTCIDGVYSPYATAFAAWRLQFINTRNANLIYKYNQIAQGRLREVVSATQPVTQIGTSVNLISDKHWNYMADDGPVSSQHPLYWTNGAYRHFPTGKDCQRRYWTFNPPYTQTNKFGRATPGMDELLVNLGPMCNVETGDAPNFGPLDKCPQTFSYSCAGDGYLFDNLATVAEAAQGTLNQPNGWQNKLNAIDPSGKMLANTIQFGLVPRTATQGKDWLGAYTDASKKVMQPYQTVCKAAVDFIKALQGSGKDIRIAVLSFERTVPPLPAAGPPYVINNVLIDDPTNKPTDSSVAPDDLRPTNLITNLIPTNDPKMETLKQKVMSVAPMRETNIGDALQTAYDLLQAQTAKDNKTRATQGIVLVTDGQPCDASGNPSPDPRQTVANWNPKVPIYCIGLNQVGNEDPGGKAFLQSMQTYLGDGINGDPAHGIAPGNGVAATTGGTYVQAPTATHLHDALVSIARRLVALVQ